MQHSRTAIGCLLLVTLLLTFGNHARAEGPLRFVISFAPEVYAKPYTGRVYVMLGAPAEGEPRHGPNWFDPKPFFARDVKDCKPNTEIVVDQSALGFPDSTEHIPTGEYAIQAVIDLQTDTHEIGNAPGNGYSATITQTLDPKTSGTVNLRIDHLVPPRKFTETDSVKLVDIPSPLLTRFYGRPIRMRAGVVLPEGYDPKGTRRYPILYIIPGFGGDHFMAQALNRFWPIKDPLIRVVLDPDAATGHHVFADSANNGPRGEALIKELIPYIERQYHGVGKPGARFVNGHSSGGWSSLWLQVAYPDFFGGVWSTSPDPVDFRDFQRINLYGSNENMFYDAAGQPRPLARIGTRPIVFYKPFSDMETVLGHGGQLMSFEAVFSPRGKDGKPLELWDRKTGAIHPDVARDWEKYDIRLKLERNWPTLGPKLRGKLHVVTGELDTFYLEGAVRLLKASLEKLGSDAVVEIQPGKNHGNIMSRELIDRMESEIMATYHRNFPNADTP